MKFAEPTEEKIEGNGNQEVDLYYELFEREIFSIQTVGEFSSTHDVILKDDETAVDDSETVGSDQYKMAEHLQNNCPEMDFEQSSMKLRNTVDPGVHDEDEISSESRLCSSGQCQVGAEKDLPNVEQPCSGVELNFPDLEFPDSPPTCKDEILHSDGAQKREEKKRGEFENLQCTIEETSIGKENMRGERDDEVLSESQLSSRVQHKVKSADISDFSDSNLNFSDPQPADKGGIHQSDSKRLSNNWVLSDSQLSRSVQHKVNIVDLSDFSDSNPDFSDSNPVFSDSLSADKGGIHQSAPERSVQLKNPIVKRNRKVGSESYGGSKEYLPVNKLRREANLEDSLVIGKEPVLSARIQNRKLKTGDSRRSHELIADSIYQYRGKESSHSLGRRRYAEIRRDRSRSSRRSRDNKRKKFDRNKDSRTSRFLDDQLSKEEDIEKVIQLKIKELKDLLKCLPEKSRAEYETIRSHIVTLADGWIEKERRRERRNFKQTETPRKTQPRANREFDDCIVKREHRHEERIKLISPNRPRRKELKEILFPSKCPSSSIVSRENASCSDESNCEAAPLRDISSSCKKDSTFTADSKGSKKTKNRRTLDELVVNCLSEQRNQVEELEDSLESSYTIPKSNISEYDADKTKNIVEDVSSTAHSHEDAITTCDTGIEKTASTVSLGNTRTAVGPEVIPSPSLTLSTAPSSEPQETASSSNASSSKAMTHSSLSKSISRQPGNRWDQLMDLHLSKQQISLSKPQCGSGQSSINGNRSVEKPGSVSSFSAPIQETAGTQGEDACTTITQVCKNYPKAYQTLGELLLGPKYRPEEKVLSRKLEDNREKETMAVDKVPSPSALGDEVIAVCDMDIEEETDSKVDTVETSESVALQEINVSNAFLSVSKGIDCSGSDRYSPQLDDTISVHADNGWNQMTDNNQRPYDGQIPNELFFNPQCWMQPFPNGDNMMMVKPDYLLPYIPPPQNTTPPMVTDMNLQCHPPSEGPRFPGSLGSTLNNLGVLLGSPSKSGNTYCTAATENMPITLKHAFSAPPLRDLLEPSSLSGNTYCRAEVLPKHTRNGSITPKHASSAAPHRDVVGLSSSGNDYCTAAVLLKPTGSVSVPPKPASSAPPSRALLGSSSTSGNDYCEAADPLKPTGSVSVPPKPASASPPRRDLLGSFSSSANGYCKAAVPLKPTENVSVPPKPASSTSHRRDLVGSFSSSTSDYCEAAVLLKPTGSVSVAPKPATSASPSTDWLGSSSEPLRLTPQCGGGWWANECKLRAVRRIAITRAKSEEILNKSCVHVAVAPKDYPFCRLTNYEIDLLKHSLSLRLPLASRLDVDDSFGETGALIIKCNDRSVLDWLWEVASKMVPWPGAQLKPVVWTKPRISFEVPQELADKPWQVLCQKLTYQNPFVNPAEWQFFKFVTRKATKFAIFVIDVPSFAALQNAEFKLYLGFSKIVCSLLESRFNGKPRLKIRRAEPLAQYLCTST